MTFVKKLWRFENTKNFYVQKWYLHTKYVKIQIISQTVVQRNQQKKPLISENFSTFSHKRSFICKSFLHITNNSSFRSITNSICSLF